MAHEEHNVRQILLDLGIGDYNATLVIQSMFMAPAQTDPAMATTQLVTKAMQRTMIGMGASWVKQTGYLDDGSAHCLSALVGPHWNQTTWFELAQALLAAKRSGRRFSKNYSADMPGGVALEGLGLGLPDVPGGLLTYGVAAYLLYRHFKKKG